MKDLRDVKDLGGPCGLPNPGRCCESQSKVDRKSPEILSLWGYEPKEGGSLEIREGGSLEQLKSPVLWK